MLLEFLVKNISFFFEVLVLIGGWLVMIGAMRSDLSAIKKRIDKHDERLELEDGRWEEHLGETSPHKSCLVEAARHADATSTMADLKKAIVRVEGWVMALANKQGIKGPYNNGD